MSKAPIELARDPPGGRTMTYQTPRSRRTCRPNSCLRLASHSVATPKTTDYGSASMTTSSPHGGTGTATHHAVAVDLVVVTAVRSSSVRRKQTDRCGPICVPDSAPPSRLRAEFVHRAPAAARRWVSCRLGVCQAQSQVRSPGRRRPKATSMQQRSLTTLSGQRCQRSIAR